MPLVSVIVPCRNEAAHVDAFLQAAHAQALPTGWSMELLVADGRSDDGTRERRARQAIEHPGLRIVDNPAGQTAHGLNRALAAATGEVIVRMDVHTTYAPDYVAACLDALQRTGAAAVGGPWRAHVGTGRAEAIALAWGSRFGSGGAASRRVDHSGPVDTVYLGAWRRETLQALGGFDETLLRTEDDDLNLRIVRGGGVVWQDAAIRSWYRPRASFGALAAQMYQYGYWKWPLIRKHRMPASPRHLVPALFVGSVGVLALAGLVHAGAALAALALVALHAAAALAAAATLAPPWRRPLVWLGATWATLCMHWGYGVGFLHALLDHALGRRRPGAGATRLTR
jgi:glycosyltransferase involved in cell wall biosynthesis